jgi:3-oxoacyl-[acyl-carrier-protein] synthase II
MSASLEITGCGVLSAAGIGLEPLLSAVTAAEPPAREDGDFAVANFDVRTFLGRKGTAFLDRSTALALVACGQALEDSGLRVDEGNRERVGVVLGTSVGSLRSMSDYTRETLVEERPYLVNPALFPNTVMNCAAGQSAIRYGLAGVNATLAGGELAFLSVLRYAASALRRGYADTLLAGAVEELSPHRSRAVQLQPDGPPAGAGEAAAVFVVEPAGSGRPAAAEVLAVTAGFDPEGNGALRDRLAVALEAAGAEPARVSLAAGSEAPDEQEALARELGIGEVRRFPWRSHLGACQAAAAGLQVATLLALGRHAPASDGQLWALAGREPDGAVAAAVIRLRGPAPV